MDPRVSSSLSYKTNKWYAKVKPHKIGDLGIVQENYLRNTRSFDKIKEIYTDQDGQFRVVDAATLQGLYRRFVTKISIISSEGG